MQMRSCSEQGRHTSDTDLQLVNYSSQQTAIYKHAACAAYKPAMPCTSPKCTLLPRVMVTAGVGVRLGIGKRLGLRVTGWDTLMVQVRISARVRALIRVWLGVRLSGQSVVHKA